ncbi:MAG: lipocalin-like domain-containing protein [Saprospiraceae bacterium]|nr:lipocalin-like domain-containing protein [Saprospiraceae bacterium]
MISKIFSNHFIILIWLASLLMMHLSFHFPDEKDHSDFERFTGRWSLFVVESKVDSISAWMPRKDHYKNRQGFIIYDGIGGMGVHHVTEHYQDYQFESYGAPDNLTTNDLKHLANNFVYFGKYRVIDSLKIIEHHIESSNLPRLWATVEKRAYVFSDDTLTLSPITDRYPKSRLKWVKMDDEW